MNATTYFRAMNKVKAEMECLVANRGFRGNRGIAIDNDCNAIRWQHRDRQYRKFGKVIEDILSAYDYEMM